MLQEGQLALTMAPFTPPNNKDKDKITAHLTPNSSSKSGLPTAVVHIFEGAVQRKSTGMIKNFKYAYVVFTDVTLNFYADEAQKKLEYSLPTADCTVSLSGPRDQNTFCVSCGATQLFLKMENADIVEQIVDSVQGDRNE